MYIIGFSKVYKDILWLKAIFYKTPIGLINWEKISIFWQKYYIINQRMKSWKISLKHNLSIFVGYCSQIFKYQLYEFCYGKLHTPECQLISSHEVTMKHSDVLHWRRLYQFYIFVSLRKQDFLGRKKKNHHIFQWVLFKKTWVWKGISLP